MGYRLYHAAALDLRGFAVASVRGILNEVIHATMCILKRTTKEIGTAALMFTERSCLLWPEMHTTSQWKTTR
ncbi:hypothetical protein Tcan_01911 [Toxocara canis]|uniref:Uncharacterized protein n=1 Tax=Toxocara canis TaxID=6265 RepID=A0A0B2VBN9_TOXCA|nr:hypothetical protein Tcan_01911 [Toxocara canis]